MSLRKTAFFCLTETNHSMANHSTITCNRLGELSEMGWGTVGVRKLTHFIASQLC